MTFKRFHLSIPVILILIALAFVTADSAQAGGKSIQFVGQPSEVIVKSGNAQKAVLKVRASGIPKGRIRYSLSGHPAFKISKKSGRIQYDGRALHSPGISLKVKANDRKGILDSATHEVRVLVARSWPIEDCWVGLELGPGAGCDLDTVQSIKIRVTYVNSLRISHKCLGIFTCVTRYSGNSYTGSGRFEVAGLSMAKQRGVWVITALPATRVF